MNKLTLMLFVLSSGASMALEDAAVRKKMEELNDKNPTVRVAAIKDLGPLYTDLMAAMQLAYNDADPGVIEALKKLETDIQRHGNNRALTPQMQAKDIARRETQGARACRKVYESEIIYIRTDYTGKGKCYAPTLKGDNSLFEKKAGAADMGLIEQEIADAEAPAGKTSPKGGYCFKILTKQGAAAPGGAKSYLKNGKLTEGFAVFAYPYEYGVTGKRCWMVGANGVMFEKDLGPDTAALAEKLDEYNPDKSWVTAE
jgi:hypothetical protein